MTTKPQKIRTSHTEIYYKEIINDEKKVIDKVYIIRYKDEIGRDKIRGKLTKSYCSKI